MMGVLNKEPIIIREYAIQSLEIFDKNMQNNFERIINDRPKDKTTFEQVEKIHSNTREEILRLQKKIWNIILTSC